MKFFKIVFLIIFIYFCFLPVFATGQSQLPGASKLQPITPDVRPNISGNIDRNELNPKDNNLSPEQLSQYEFNEEELNKNTIYIDTVNHILFVADTGNNRIFIYNLNSENILIDYIPDNVLGQPDFITSTPGTTPSKLDGPQGIAYDPATSSLFVADTNNNRVMVFDVSSIVNGENAVNVLGQPDFFTSDEGITPSGLNGPYSLDFDPTSGNLFVSDIDNNRIMVFNTANPITNGENAVNVLGQPDFITSTPGTTPSKLDGPQGIAYDPATSSLFVADTNNNRVMVFDVSSIVNGENAVNVVDQFEDLPVSLYVAERVQDNPKNNSEILANPSRNKKSSFNLVSFVFWFVAFLMLAIIAFIYLKPKMK